MSKPKKESSVWVEIKKKDLPILYDQILSLYRSVYLRGIVTKYKEFAAFEKKLFIINQKNNEQ